MNSTTQEQFVEAACLQVQSPDGDVSSYELIDGEMLLIGSGKSCGVVLPEETVAAMHCTLSFIDGLVRVRDWSSATGTLVDGNRIVAETVVSCGIEIRIGSYRLQIVGGEASSATAAMQVLDKVDLLLGDATGSVSNETAVSDEQTAVDSETIDDDAVPNSRDAVRAREESFTGYNPDPFEDDTLELLKAEVELLQSELAERDARLAELESLADIDGDLCDSPQTADSPEMEWLVERLEQLLTELERSDERLSMMADLLRAADDASAAEFEERRQIESWIGEIERRLTERELERGAEQQVLQRKATDLQSQLERAERQLDEAADGGNANVDRDNYVAQIRRDYAALEAKLLQSEAERDQLSTRLDAADVEAIEAQTQAAVEQALREEHLAIAQERTTFSQERAAFARERAELTRLRDELEDKRQKFDADPDNANQRIRAFRDHLREIHETEVPPERPQGLSARIGKLWRRLEGRPLDTD